MTHARFTTRRPADRFRVALDDAHELPLVRFLAEVAERGLPYVAHDRFAGAIDPAALGAEGDVVVVRAQARGETLEAFVRLDVATLALVDVGWGQVRVEVAAGDLAHARAAVGRLRERFARPEPPPSTVELAFWRRGARGEAVMRSRTVSSPAWDDLAANYAAGVRSELARLVALDAPGRGRLLVWRGPPGTGKTWAMRALAGAWRSWASLHVVLDPFALFGHDPGYLLDVLAYDEDDEDRWRVLEDAGELLRADAAGLGPLLNLTDGLLGEGTRTLVLVTTNEPVGALHPAVRRAGRCLSDLEFGPLAADEANAWLAARDVAATVSGPTPLTDLFALAGGDDGTEPAPVPVRRVGFV